MRIFKNLFTADIERTEEEVQEALETALFKINKCECAKNPVTGKIYCYVQLEEED
jgi:sporulation-control protein spo0M